MTNNVLNIGRRIESYINAAKLSCISIPTVNKSIYNVFLNYCRGVRWPIIFKQETIK
jgi:hypothetical protein